jgi:hypothetical protein
MQGLNKYTMRNWINLLNEYADPEKRQDGTFYQGEAHYAPKSLWEREGFKEWFQGSHVAAPNGEPLVAFHGSYERFTEFKLHSEKRRAYGFNRLGYWFDIDPRTPEYFAGFSHRGKQASANSEGGVMPCVLSIKKPFSLDSEFIYTDDIKKLDDANKELVRLNDLRNDKTLSAIDQDNAHQKHYEFNKKYDELRRKIMAYEHETSERIDGFHTLMKLLPKGAKSTDAEVDAFRESLIAEGHDGIYLGDTAADFGTRAYAGTDWWIAFHPNQIKSIFAQSFSDSPDIMK